MTGPYPDNPGPYPYGSAPYPPGGYGYGPPPYQRLPTGMATAALVLGILALVFCWTVVGGIVLGLVAVILGAIAVRRAGRGVAGGRGRAIAGLITGVIGIIIGGGLIAFWVAVFNSPSVQDYTTCVANANGDRAAIQQCQQQFRNQVGGG